VYLTTAEVKPLFGFIAASCVAEATHDAFFRAVKPRANRLNFNRAMETALPDIKSAETIPIENLHLMRIPLRQHIKTFRHRFMYSLDKLLEEIHMMTNNLVQIPT